MTWIERDDDWLGQRRPAPRKPAAQVAVQDDDTPVPEYGITVDVLKCPKPDCRSMDVERYKTLPWEDGRRKKYYRCRDCGYRFRVTEVDRG